MALPDAFTRANSGDLGTEWTTVTSDGAFSILSNSAVPTSYPSDSAEYYNAITPGNDQWCQAVFPTIGTAGGGVGTGLGLGLRMATGTRTYYRLVACAAGTELGVRDSGGTYSTLKTDTTAWANGDTIYFEVSGTTLTVKRNGSTISALTTTDSTLSSGRIGVTYSSEASGTNPNLDDFDGGTLGGGAATLTISTMTLMGVQ